MDKNTKGPDRCLSSPSSIKLMPNLYSVQLQLYV
jgi:hypothetical protein